MPIYEYTCTKCKHKFEALRSITKADDGAICPKCSNSAKRILSRFASFSKNADGSSAPVAGAGGSCSSCTSSSCSSCH